MDSPAVSFFVSGHPSRIDTHSELWSLPLQGEGTFSSGKSGVNTGSRTILIGDFLEAVQRFLEKDHFSGIRNGISILSGLIPENIRITHIGIRLEKHGAFYHPLKITVILSTGETCRFVVNGAVSGPGLLLVETEFNLLSRLAGVRNPSFLPRVFTWDVIQTPKGGMAFFLGEWFENYLEFHITLTPDGPKTGVWAENGDIRLADDPDAVHIYRSAAKILTVYYSLSSGEQIFPWHHAAGDFVVKPSGTGFDVKLITVRGYDSLLQIPSGSLKEKDMMLAGLLYFFINLTLRMRLDKIDGTKETAWLSDNFIPAIIDGFLEGLDEKTPLADIPDLKHLFLSFSAGIEDDQLNQIALTVVDSFNPSSPEVSLIRRHLKPHCRKLTGCLKKKAGQIRL